MTRLAVVGVLVLLAAPAWADEDEDDLAPISPVKPSAQPKRTKKKVTTPAPATPTTTPAPRETFEPLELTDTPAVAPKPPAPTPEPRPAAAAPAPSTSSYEDPDLTAATQANKKTASPLATVGWVAAGVGAAALVTGAIVGGLAGSARSGLMVDSRGVVAPGDAEQAGAAVRLSRMSSGLLIFGGVAAAGGLLLALWPAMSRPASAVRLLPSAGPGTASLMLEGVWP
jgi:hypothetical protein